VIQRYDHDRERENEADAIRRDLRARCHDRWNGDVSEIIDDLVEVFPREARQHGFDLYQARDWAIHGIDDQSRSKPPETGGPAAIRRGEKRGKPKSAAACGQDMNASASGDFPVW
jgi:hypothetical protein